MLDDYHRSLRRSLAQASDHLNLALRFLGVGTAHAVELGSAGAVLERDGAPVLMIDCGPETLTRYLDTSMRRCRRAVI